MRAIVTAAWHGSQQSIASYECGKERYVNWISDNPILAFLLALAALGVIERTVRAVVPWTRRDR